MWFHLGYWYIFLGGIKVLFFRITNLFILIQNGRLNQLEEDMVLTICNISSSFGRQSDALRWLVGWILYPLHFTHKGVIIAGFMVELQGNAY